MESKTTKLKILSVAGVLTSATQKGTTRTVAMQVAEIPINNPFGHNKESANPFEVVVYNHNIESFNIGPSLVGEVAYCELMISHYNGGGGPSIPKFIVNDLTFRI